MAQSMLLSSTLSGQFLASKKEISSRTCLESNSFLPDLAISRPSLRRIASRPSYIPVVAIFKSKAKPAAKKVFHNLLFNY